MNVTTGYDSCRNDASVVLFLYRYRRSNDASVVLFLFAMIAGDNSHRGNFVSPEIKKKNVKGYISYPYETSK